MWRISRFCQNYVGITNWYETTLKTMGKLNDDDEIYILGIGNYNSRVLNDITCIWYTIKQLFVY